jgi:colanic acid/amylovoran biosynthesis glycosyltransferase
MKILIFAHDYPHYVSGPNIWLQRLLPELRSRNIECKVLFRISGDINHCRTVQRLKSEGFGCAIYTGSIYTDHRVKWILKAVQSEKPDIFIPNLDIPSFYASRWIKEAGIPTVGILRSDEERYWGILDAFVTQPSPYLLSGLVCVSRYLEVLAKSKNPNGVVIRRIPSGTTLPPKTARIPEERMRLIYSGRLVEEQKQISKTASALCRAVREIGGTEAVLYGAGEAESSVARIISEQGAGYPVTLAGRVDGDVILDKLLEGHVFVLLSDYEGLPVSLMEAMAAGLVPVCLDIRSGVPELVEHNRTGLLVNDRGDGFIEAVHRLRADTGLWERLSKAARAKIETEYSYKKTADRWIELFHELLDRSPVKKRDISLNGKLELPEVHPLFGKKDHRWPGYGKFMYRKIRRNITRSFKAMREGENYV